jgi:hypothetical protein
MPVDLILPVSMVMGLLGWTLAFRWYAQPALDGAAFSAAMRPLLLLHSFRYIGLMFLIPGVTAQSLDPRFAQPAAYGDLLAALLAIGALAAIRYNRPLALGSVAVFDVVGFLDLINAVARGLLFTPDGALGATFWIPMVIVPLLIVTHVYIFGRLYNELRKDWVGTVNADFAGEPDWKPEN